MKSLIYMLLILGGAFLVYDYFGAPKAERLVFERVVLLASEFDLLAGKQSVSAPVDGKAVVNVFPAQVPKAGFVAPAFESLGSLTKNWTAIPVTAFPRSVKLSREMEFKMAAGTSRMAAGSVVTALSCENGMLTLAPTPNSSARGFSRVDDTDLKTQFVEPYQKWIAWRTEILRRQWERAQIETAGHLVSTMPSGAVDESGKPNRNADGSYPLLLASMSAGQVTDITPKKVKRVESPRLVTSEGKPTWVIDVHYDTIVFCGPMEAHAQAHIRDGKVIRWVYPGSGEPVP